MDIDEKNLTYIEIKKMIESLSDRDKARLDNEKCAVISSILSSFFVHNDEKINKLILENWLSVLDISTVREIKAAWVQYQHHGARMATGVLIKPDAGAIYKLISKARPVNHTEELKSILGNKKYKDAPDYLKKFADEYLKKHNINIEELG